MNNEPSFVRAMGPRALLPVLACAVAFIVDLMTPNGMADGFLYIAAVLVCVWLPDARSALYTALALTAPMTAGLALSPAGVPIEIAVMNRCVAMGAIWLAAIAVWRKGRWACTREAALLEALRAVERTVWRERLELSAWLREEVSQELVMVDWRLRQISHSPRRRIELQSEALVLRRAIQRAIVALLNKIERLRDTEIPAAAVGVGR